MWTGQGSSAVQTHCAGFRTWAKALWVIEGGCRTHILSDGDGASLFLMGILSGWLIHYLQLSPENA